jgi:hypothetical protein
MIQDACEATKRQVKGLKTKQWFIRLGTQYIGDLCSPGFKGRAPRVRNIRAKRKDFKDGISKLPAQQQANLHQVEEEEEGELKEGEIEDVSWMFPKLCK